MTLAEEVSRRLRLAGFRYNDPALEKIRRWNAGAYARAADRESRRRVVPAAGGE